MNARWLFVLCLATLTGCSSSLRMPQGQRTDVPSADGGEQLDPEAGEALRRLLTGELRNGEATTRADGVTVIDMRATSAGEALDRFHVAAAKADFDAYFA